MTPRRAAALLAAGLAVLACGKYGPPVRSREQATVAEPAGTGDVPARSGSEAGGASAPEAAADPTGRADETDTPESQESQP